MKVIVSPAKKMKFDEYVDIDTGVPVFLEQAKELTAYMKSMSLDELKAVWNCSDSIANDAYDMLMCSDFNLTTPAINSYDGIAYKYMAPAAFETGEYAYVQDNLRILSGLYGVLKPLDGVIRYRLEMQSRLPINKSRSLYEYWSDAVYRELTKDDDIIINLASKEYSKCVEKYISGSVRMVTCIFGELSGDKVVQKGVYAKMARGEMVRYLAINNIHSVEEIKGFNHLGYEYSKEHSDNDTFTFIR